MKKVVSLLVIIFICIMVTACKGYDYYAPPCREFGLEELSKKYNEEFEYIEDYKSGGTCYSLFCDPYNFLVKTKDKNSPVYDKEIFVSVDNCKKGNKEESDDYVALKYEKDANNLLESIFNKYFKEIKFYNVRIAGVNKDLNNKTTLEEYLKAEETSVSGTIEIRESDFKNISQINNISDELIKNIGRYGLYLVISKDKYFGVDTEEELRKILLDKDYSKKIEYAYFNNYNDEVVANLYRENKVAKKYESQMKEYLNKVVTKYFKSAIFERYYDNGEELYTLDINSTFKEYLKNRDTRIYVSYGVKKEEYSKENVEKLANELISSGLEFKLEIYILDEQYQQGDKISRYPSVEVTKDLNKEVKYRWE